MDIVLWIIAGVLAAAFAAAGAMKLTQPKEKLAASGIAWTDRKEAQVIGVNVVLLLLAAAVAWGRFGPYSFGS